MSSALGLPLTGGVIDPKNMTDGPDLFLSYASADWQHRMHANFKEGMK
jgi:hypothetical protein